MGRLQVRADQLTTPRRPAPAPVGTRRKSGLDRRAAQRKMADRDRRCPSHAHHATRRLFADGNRARGVSARAALGRPVVDFVDQAGDPARERDQRHDRGRGKDDIEGGAPVGAADGGRPAADPIDAAATIAAYAATTASGVGTAYAPCPSDTRTADPAAARRRTGAATDAATTAGDEARHRGGAEAAATSPAARTHRGIAGRAAAARLCAAADGERISQARATTAAFTTGKAATAAAGGDAERAASTAPATANPGAATAASGATAPSAVRKPSSRAAALAA